MTRASKIKGDHIFVPLWLIFDRNGNVRMTRSEPSCHRNERAMRLIVTVPLALFVTPTISATMTIAAPGTALPEIDLTAAAEALKGVVGCDIDIRVLTDQGEVA